MGLIGFVVAALVGQVPITYIPTTLFLRRPAVWLRVLSRHRGTITYAPNFAYALVASRVRDTDIEGIDLSALRVAGCGGEPIQAETLRAFARRYTPRGFRESAFVPSYGMAESALGIAFGNGIPSERVRLQALTSSGRAEHADNDEAAVELVGCGKPFAGHELRIVEVDGDTRVSQPARRVGEIEVRGASVMRGYFEDPAQSRLVLGADGWLRTGDLGYLDEHGHLFVCGRLKDLIIVNGHNHAPQDLEWAAAQVDGVRLGGVVAFATLVPGVPTEAAVVVAEAKQTGDSKVAERIAGDIRRAIQLALGLVVEHVLLVRPRTIPRTSSGKLRRARARQLYESGGLAWNTSPHAASEQNQD
jgi:fatty-acyl-CoA synthase